ncbi:MAG TPA: hypothetical protein VE172_13380 [Stackebrandtia sp.]|uniref:hypothetical protein n=1 Tax=Stackebrandtia sp. TaxID=2023065 RepID=UPI002D226BBA|nr:hypothetical protein [Stackebrandtia sp.]HZE39794.1 hypothetical protein [Stackebrandtia sp.]
MGTSQKKDDKKADRMRQLVVWLLCGGMVVAVGWIGNSCLRQHADEPRHMTSAEAKRLAKVRVNNQKAGPTAMSVELPESAGGGQLRGQIDWSQPLVSAQTLPAGKSRPDGLVQAVPGLIASHGAKSAGARTLPASGWSVHRMRQQQPGSHASAHQIAGDIVMSALLTLHDAAPADPAVLRDKGVWLREAAIDGATVDVFRAPLLLDAPTPTPGSTHGRSTVPEAVFWVDHHSRLRRVQFDPASAGLATVDFLLEQKQPSRVEPIDLLGGGPIKPRGLKTGEADQLASLRQHNAGGGAEISVELPSADNAMTRARGYVDWRGPMVYLSVDAPGKKDDGLMYALPGGAATRPGKPTGMPPLTVPTDGWTSQPWKDRSDGDRATDLDTLLFKVMAMASPQADDPGVVKKDASFLREDSLDGVATGVYEFPIAGDPKTKQRGQAPFRFWVDGSDDRLRRVELRTNGLGMAHADLDPAAPESIPIPDAVRSALVG